MSSHRWPIAPAAVALDLLDPDEQPLAAQLLTSDPAFAAEVARLRTTTTTLSALDADAWSPEPPPSLDRPASAGRAQPRAPEEDVAPAPAGEAARRGAMAGDAAPRGGAAARGEAQGGAVAASGGAHGGEVVRGGAWWRRRRVVSGALAATAAAAAVVAIVVAGNGGGEASFKAATTVALRPLAAGGAARASLGVNAAGTEAELRGSGLAPNGPHDYYEAWVADARGKMVSMGTFKVPTGGAVDVHMAVGVDLGDYTLVDVSLEPDDGNPAHSDRSVLRARL